MGFWDTLIQTNQNKDGATGAYASMYPVYEQTTPQWPQPNPYTLAAQGYRANELVYACIQKRMDAISEPPLLVYDDVSGKPAALEEHPLRELIEAPCEGVTEKAFWGITEIMLATAGFMGWEKEYNRMGQVIHLWPMRPDWCSFYRGDGRPIRAVRYQPYGLPPQDIPREKVLLFQHFDPLFPLLKGLSPVGVAMRTVGVDNAATDYLKTFFQQGSVIAGLLTSDQSINDTTASMLRTRWRETHGGVQNWGDIAVLGNGTKYQQLNMNFRDMAFPELDGRDESRICAVLKVPPILVGAKVGLNASTYSNYEQARKAFYEETVTTQWRSYENEIKVQLLPDFEQAGSIYPAFDTRNVRALQENRDAQFKRGIDAARANVITRDEARQEMGLDPIDNSPVFVGITVRAMDQGGIGAGGTVEGTVVGDVPADQQTSQADMTDEENDALKAARDLERRQFSEFAAKRIKEGRPQRILNFRFQYLDAGEQAELMTRLPETAWRNYP